MSIIINDQRTNVTEVFLEESKYADGTKKLFVAYRVKGNSGTRLVNGGSGSSYSSLQKVDEDHVKALAENGDWHTYTIGSDGVWSGLQRGFTEAQSASGKADKKAKREAKREAKRAKRGAIKNFILEEIPAPLNWIIYPVLWIISSIFKLIWWLIKLVLVIVTFGWASGWFED